MWQSIAASYGGKLKQMREQLRKRHYGPLSDRWDTHLEFAAYKRILYWEEPGLRDVMLLEQSPPRPRSGATPP